MDYAEQLKLIEERKLNGSNSLYIGNAPALTAAGFYDAPFAMNQADYRKARRKEGNNKHYSSHAIPLSFFKKLPQKINDSVIFIDNGIKVTIITDYKMLDEVGKPSFVVAGVWRNQKMDNDVVNQVKSAYPLKDFANQLLRAGKEEKLVITDKNKAKELFASIGVQPAEQSNILGLAKSSITQPAAGSQEENGGTRTESEGNGGTIQEQKTFSLKSPVEATRDLVAVHNMTADQLQRSLDLGGLPMPSIAILKAQSGHTRYGDVSLVFDKSTIDPQESSKNKVYGGDAWTHKEKSTLIQKMK